MQDKQLKKIKTYFQKSLVFSINTRLSEIGLKIDGQSIQKIRALLESDSSVNRFIDVFCKTINAVTLENKWTSKQKNFLLNKLSNIDLIDSTMQFVAEQIVADDIGWLTNQDVAIPDVALNINVNEIIAAIEFFHKEFLSPNDQRVQTEERPIRRMDSLSRILSFNSRTSACTSVSFLDNKIYVSANVSQDGQQDDIAKHIFSRLHKLQKFIFEFKSALASNNFLNIEDYLETHSLTLANEMIFEAGTGADKTRIASDISKFVHSMVVDDASFDIATRNIWFTDPLPATILLPQKGNMEEVSLAIYDKTAESPTRFELPNAKYHAIVSNFHAEQMMVYYFKQNDMLKTMVENPLLIGISKLCCKTCYANLDGLPVKVRGTHNQAYENVEPLLHREYIPPTTPKGDLLKGDCAAFHSLLKSHLKGNFLDEPSDRDISSVRRKLFSSPDEDMDGSLYNDGFLDLEPEENTLIIKAVEHDESPSTQKSYSALDTIMFIIEWLIKQILSLLSLSKASNPAQEPGKSMEKQNSLVSRSGFFYQTNEIYQPVDLDVNHQP